MFTPINRCAMTSAKGQNSSRHKGKEVVSDSPTARDVGKEVVYSKSDHYNEEEAPCAPNNECAPLIDPWYDIHPHFPKVPSDYTPLLLGCVWLALCQRNTDVSWAPLASSIPDLIIHQGTSLPVPIHFEFGSSTALGWREWVDRELSDTSFIGLLQRAGVLKAIVSSRCLSNYKDLFNLRHLVHRGCTTTHTFFFSYDKVMVTLEDVVNQLLLPILGDVDPSALEFSTEEEAVETELKKRMSGNAKLSYWVSSPAKISDAARRATFITF